MRLLIPGFLVAFGLLAGCGIAQPDPKNYITVDIVPVTTVGAPTTATVHAERATKAGCGGLLDECWAHEDLGATITSVTCAPSEACGSLVLNGASATWVSLAEQYDVTVVADGDGVHGAQTVAVTASAPDITVESAGHALRGAILAGNGARFCVAGLSSQVLALDVDLDGAALAPVAVDADCVTVKPPRKGALHAALRIVATNQEIAHHDAPVHDFSEPFDLRLSDAVCGTTPMAYARFERKKWQVHVVVTAVFDGFDEYPIDGATLAFRDGERAIPGAGTELDVIARPSSKATLEASFSGTKDTIDIRAFEDASYCPGPNP